DVYKRQVSALYDGLAIPQAGRLISFVGDEDSHGTNCAGDIAAQGIITDPEWVGPINPLFAGGENVGGVGGPVLAGMAPGAKIAAFQNGFALPFDSWVLAALGFDGVPDSGDEAQLVNNSWGASATINDGWDATSRFAHWLNRNYAPNTAFLVSTGNGGHGYGTVTEPDGGSIIDVGASTSYGSLVYFEFVMPEQFTWGDVIPWSNRGPGTLGDVAPDVVAVGAWGTGANPLNLYYGNGQAAYDIFGGTSMAAPIATGNLALIYQAFQETHGRWPTWQEAKAILLNSARDLGYDVLTQGSGNVDADRGTDIAAGANYGYWVEPAQWVAGDYRGSEYPAFPSIMHPGDTAVKTFTIYNAYTDTYSVDLSDAVLQRVNEVTFTLSFPSFSPPPFTRPTWITDITDLIDDYDPDLVRAQVLFPYSVFDTDYNYSYEDRWRVLFYDWTDLNGDENLWTDTNGNGRVDAGEIDVVSGIAEYNRFTYGYPTGTYLEASVGRDSLSRRHDGVFFGVQRRTGGEAVTLQVRITFYKKVDWDWLTLAASSVNLPAGGNATFQATMSVPADARPGVYEGAIEVSYGTYKHVIPVVVHVAADSPNFEFGAASLTEPIGDQPYDNGHLFGGFDWTWRYEAGDWKLFYFDIPDGTAAPGKAMIVDTQWVNPVPPPPPSGAFFYEDFESWPPTGWSIINNGANLACVWESTAHTKRPNYTGGSGYAADADSDWCGLDMDTELRTPVLDLSGASQAWLMFRSDFNDYQNQDHGYVDISTDGGATWTNLLHYDRQDYRGPRTEIINLTPYVGSANTIIRFNYVAPDWDWWWEVDEVGIYLEEPTPPPMPQYTDVDTWIYAAAPDLYSASDPAFFGPQSVEQVGGSNNTNVSAGIFTFDTATSGPREVVGGELRDGLGFIALHNVLYAGTQFGEPVVGRAYQVQATPAPVEMVTSRVVSTAPLQFSDSWVETFTTAYTLTEGLGTLIFGLSQPQSWSDVALSPGPDECDWVYTFTVSSGGLIEATAWSENIADIDLYLYGPVSASSTTPTAWEQVRVKRLPDGDYQLCVDNWSETSGTFNMVLRVIQGTDLVMSGLPQGTINANTPVTFTITFTKAAALDTTWEGLLYIGPASAPTALEIPITIRFASFGLTLSPETAALSGRPGEVVTYTLTVTNTGTYTDTFTVAVSGNAWTTTAPPTVGPVGAGGSTSFQVAGTIPTGLTGANTDTATVAVTSQGDNTKSAQAVLTTTRVFYRLFMPVVVRNYRP
ncbi:MAG: S8 family serine peptidase, partial [Anaerolineae bacterium]|nr:S8 family serine peptidase [Anaerolineae bacterium]